MLFFSLNRFYFPSRLFLKMARKPRLYYPGALYHVMLRGNGGQPIFFSSPDYRQFYHLLQEAYQRFDHRIHAFCLMSNHVHLAIEVGAIPLAPIMQNISFRYTRWINQRQKRMGHLFQGRYKALLVDQENYLLALIRYIHLNPIRAGVAKELVDFPWCSHLAYLGKRRQHPLLSSSFRTDHSSSGSSFINCRRRN